MAQGFLLPLPPRIFDANGAPAVGWQVSTFLAGSSTPIATFSDAALTSANTNPIITNASGYYTAGTGIGGMFVAEAVLVDIDVANAAGVPQYSFDSIEAMPNTTGSSGSVTAIPTGSCVWSPYSTTPTGFLPCNGAAVSRATYSALAALAATDSYPNGTGDGTTTFNLPDLRGRAAYGLAATGTGSTLGGTFGSLDHTHTGPSHTHVTTVPRDGWGATLNIPSVSGRLNTGDATGVGQFSSSYQAVADQAITSAAGGTGITSSGNAPGMAGYWFIKT